MSKILSSGEIEGNILKDVSLYTLDTVNIGQFSAKALRGVENVIIGKNAGNIALNINKSIYIGSSACENVFSGNNNICIGSDYINANNINNILSIGYNTTLNSDSITLGNDNSNIHDINIGFSNNGLILSDSELIIKNLAISDNEINLGFFNFGVSNLNIGNYNSNNNGINIGSFNNSTINNSLIIGNNIENSNFSLNIDNFICKYTQNNGSNIIYLGISFYENIPIIIGSSNNEIITQKNGLFINGPIQTETITLNNDNNSIKIKINSNITKNNTYNFNKNSNNTFLNLNSNGNLYWIDNIYNEINYLNTTGDINAENIDCKNLIGDGRFIIKVNLENKTTDYLKEGIEKIYYKKNIFDEKFNNNLDLITTDYINVGENSNNFYFSNNLFKKYLEKNIKLINTDYITNGYSNKFYKISDYTDEPIEYFKNKNTDELKENDNKYFNESNFNLSLNNLFNSSPIIDKIREGTNNLFYTDNRYFDTFTEYIKEISTDDVNKSIINIFDNSNITLSNINNKFNNINTDIIKEGSNNKFITLNRITNIINSNLNSTDKIAPTSNFRYYNISNKVQLNSDLIAKNLNMVYYDSNVLVKNISNISTDNFTQEAQKNLFIQEKKISQVFTSIFNKNITADNIKTKTRNKFIQNNNYNNDILINGNCKVSNIPDIDLNLLLKSQIPTIGDLTDVSFNYEVDNIIFNTPSNNILDIKYNYLYNSNLNIVACNIGVPFIVVNENVGINNITPNYNLDVNGTTKSDYFIGNGSQINNLLWNNISNKPFNDLNLNYFKILNNELTIKQIEATNNELPVIYNNLNNKQDPLQINSTYNYYYIFTEGINNIKFFDNIECDVFMIGGGGGGGGYYGGGGGAGAYFSGKLFFNKNIVYNINIGSGGNGANTLSNFEGTKGGNTSITFNGNIFKLVNGGGCGASGFLNINSNIDGGCGGGGKGYKIDNIVNSTITFLGGSNNNSDSTIGFKGGFGYYLYNTENILLNKFCGGGGGGAGSNGYDVTNNAGIFIAGSGGDAILVNLTGSNMVFGGGGGGAGESSLNIRMGYGGSYINDSLNIKCGGDGSSNSTLPNGQNAIKMGSGGGGGGSNGNGGNGMGGCLIIKFNLTNYSKFKAEYDNEILPSYTWKNNINTGMYYSNNTLGFSINCNTKLKIDNGIIYGNGFGLSNIEWNNLINIPSSITSIFQSGGTLNTIFVSSNVFSSVLSGYITKTDNIIGPWVKNNDNIYYDNNVGIGTGLPTEKLEILGNIKIGNRGNKNFLLLNSGNISSNDIGYISIYNNDIEVGCIGKRENTNILLNCFNGFTGYKINGNLFIPNTGKVGIGIATPIFPFEVAGISKITKQIINTTITNSNETMTLSPLTVNNIASNTYGFNHLSNGAVSTFTNNNFNNTLNDNYPIIHLCRNGYLSNYPLKSTLCLSRWESNEINSRTKLNFLLSHNNYNNESNVLSLYSDGTVKILNKLIIGDSILGNLELTGNSINDINKYNILVSSSNDLIFKNNLNDIISINNNGITGLKTNLNLNNLSINWSNIKSLPLLLESNSLQNILTLDSFNNIVESNKTNFLIKSEASNYYFSKVDGLEFLTNSALVNQININRIIQNNIGGFYFNNINTFAVGTDIIKDYTKKFIVNGDILLDNGNIFINNDNTKPLILINNILTPLNEYDDYYYYRFYYNSDVKKLILNDYIACDIIIVGGGGNGAIGVGGGGGGGEVVFLKDIILNTGTYNLYVGNLGESSYISYNTTNIYVADAGGNGGYFNNNATNGGSGGGAYLNNTAGNKTANRIKNSYGNNGIIGSLSSYSGGGGGAGGVGLRNIGGIGYSIELNGETLLLGAGGNGYINTDYSVKPIISNTGMGGSSDSINYRGSSGTIIIKIKRCFNINNLFVSSNNFLNCMNNFGSITSNVLKDIISEFPSSNNLKYLLSDTLWVNKPDNTGIFINNNVSIGNDSSILSNDILKVFGNANLNTIKTNGISINNKEIDTIFVSSNVFLSLNSNYGTINSNVLTNILTKYLNECNVQSIIKPSQWSNIENNNILYNNNVITNKLFYYNNLPSIQFKNDITNSISNKTYTKITNTNEYYHIFDNTNGMYFLNISNSHNLCDILLVGGGGISGSGFLSGGGGAGEVIYIKNYMFNSGNYSIKIGNNNENTIIKKIIQGTSNDFFIAKAGGIGASINDSKYSIIPFLKPWAIYSADNSDNSNLYDKSGNNRHAKLSGSGFSYTNINSSIYTINGTISSSVIFPKGSIPEYFTYLIIAKYNGDAKNTLLKSQTNPNNTYFGFKDGQIGYASLNSADNPNLTNISEHTKFKNANESYNKLYYIFIKNDIRDTLNNIQINGSNIGVNTTLKGDNEDNLIINNCDWSLANLFIWDSNLNNTDINNIYSNICQQHSKDNRSIVNLIYNPRINATSGGSGGGGIVNSIGASNGIPWKINNTNISYLNPGNNASVNFGGGGGGASGPANFNIGGAGKEINITENTIYVGKGGNGSSNITDNTSITKTLYGDGGDSFGNGFGYGAKGVVIIKFYEYADLDNFYISDNTITEVALANNIINSNVLQNYLNSSKFISSNVFLNLLSNNNIIDSNILNNTISQYITSNVLSNQNYINSNFIYNSLSADLIKSGTSNKFIVNNSYSNDITFTKNVFSSNIITSNLFVIDNYTVLNTTIYQTEQLQIENYTNYPALIIKQKTINQNVAEFYNNINPSLIINSEGNVNIGHSATNTLYKLSVNGNFNATSIYNNGTLLSSSLDLKQNILNSSTVLLGDGSNITNINYNNIINKPDLYIFDSSLSNLSNLFNLAINQKQNILNSSTVLLGDGSNITNINYNNIINKPDLYIFDSSLSNVSNVLNLAINQKQNIILPTHKITFDGSNISNLNYNNIPNKPDLQQYITSNFIYNSLSADFVTSGTSNKFIVNNIYNDDITFSKNVFLSNLYVRGIFNTTVNTTSYLAEKIEINNLGIETALKVIQLSSNKNIAEFYNNISNLSLVVSGIGNIGIGKNNPQFKLDINGIINASDIYKNGELFKPSQWITTNDNSNIYYNLGNIGIGTNSPSNLFHIHNNISNSSVKIQLTDGTNDINSNSGFIISKESNQDVKIINCFSNGNMIFGTSNVEKLRITNNGNVGIGTFTNLINKLNVNGNISCTNIYGNNVINKSTFSINANNSIIINGSVEVFKYDLDLTKYTQFFQIDLTTKMRYFKISSIYSDFSKFTDISGSSYVFTQNILLTSSIDNGITFYSSYSLGSAIGEFIGNDNYWMKKNFNYITFIHGNNAVISSDNKKWYIIIEDLLN